MFETSLRHAFLLGVSLQFAACATSTDSAPNPTADASLTDVLPADASDVALDVTAPADVADALAPPDAATTDVVTPALGEDVRASDRADAVDAPAPTERGAAPTPLSFPDPPP